MDIRYIWELIVYRRRRIIPAVVALLVAVVVWVSIQFLFFRQAPPEPEPAPQVQQVVQQAPPAPQPQQAAAQAPASPPVVEMPAASQDAVFPKVMVPKRDIQAGVMLTPDLVEWREWREEIDLDNAVLQDMQSAGAVLGSVTSKDYSAGAPLAWDGIISPGGPGFMGAVLEPNMRAVTVEVDRATTAARIIYPGDRVDVIMVATGESIGAAAQAIVRDARVLAVGSTIVSMVRYGRPNLVEGATGVDMSQSMSGDTFTLEVTPADAGRIALAASAGQLTLAMRSASASSHGPLLPPTRFGDVMVEPSPPPIIERTPPVRIIRGGAGEETVEVES